MNVLKWDSFIWSNLPKISNIMPSILRRVRGLLWRRVGKKFETAWSECNLCIWISEALRLNRNVFPLQWIGKRNKSDVSHWFGLWVNTCISLSVDCHQIALMTLLHCWSCVALVSCINIPDSQASAIVILPMTRGHHGLNLKALYRTRDFTFFGSNQIPAAFCKWSGDTILKHFTSEPNLYLVGSLQKE